MRPPSTDASQDALADACQNPSPEAMQQLATQLSAQFQQWKHARARLEQTWQSCWDAYLCQPNATQQPSGEDAAYRSQVVRPVLFEAAEVIHSFLMNTLFPANDAFFSVVGKTEADMAQASIIETFLRQKLDDCHFYANYALFLKQAIITGNSIAMIPWHRQTRTETVYQPITLFGARVGVQPVVQERVIFDGPELEVLDMFDVVLDPTQTHWEQAMIIRRLRRTQADLVASGLYQNLEAIEMPTSGEVMPDPHQQHRRQAMGQQVESLSTSLQAPTIELLEAWGDFTVGDQLYRNHVCVVANGSTVIRFEPNPFLNGKKPFVFTTLTPVPNELYGIGAIEKVLSLQHAINTLTNQKLDVINISINNPFTYLVGDEVFDPETIVTRPGALIPVKSHDTLRPIQYLNNFTVAFSEIEDLKQEIQQATGAFTLRGSEGLLANSARTATEISVMATGNSQKFSSFTKHLEVTSIEPVIRHMFELAQQFVQDPVALHCVDDQHQHRYVTVSPTQLQLTQCDFRVIGSEASLLKTQELAALFEFIRLVQSDAALRAQVDMTNLYKKVYRRLGFRDEADLFHPPQAAPQPNKESA